MADQDANPAAQAARLLQRLHTCFEKRRALPGGAAREKLDAHVIATLTELAALREGEGDQGDGAPPRRFAQAFAMALSGQPHLEIFFGEPTFDATTDVETPPTVNADLPLVFEPTVQRDVLGLQDWELDDLREEVDRRAGLVLKQQRAVSWLWGHFGLPESSAEPLFRVLFPGADHAMGPVSLVRNGGQIYALVDSAPIFGPAGLYLGWGDSSGERVFGELGPFGGRYVDASLRQALGRGIGASDDEVIDLLGRMVTVVPRGHAQAFLRHDAWRIAAFAGITRLGDDYAAPVALTSPLKPEEIALNGVLSRDAEGHLVVGDARGAFDALALPRAEAMVRHLCAELLARLAVADATALITPDDDALELFDVAGHIKRALAPVLKWAADPKTANHVARELKVSGSRAAEALAKVHAVWTAQAEHGWYAPPRSGQPRSVASVAVMFVVDSWWSLSRQLAMPRDEAMPHHDLLLLCAAHLFAEAPLQQLWQGGLTSVGAPVDVGGLHLFWPTWLHLLEVVDEDPETFSGHFTLDQ